MNSILAHITHINSEGSFRLISLAAGTDSFKSIIIDNGSAVYQKGDEVKLLFKETEVSIATEKLAQISLQNQIAGKIKSIEKDALLARIILDTNQGLISSIITADSAERLQLKTGDSAVALIKTNEIMLASI